MFEIQTVNLDYKDLQIIQSSLELQIKEISDVNFDGSHEDYLQEHKDLYNRISKKFDILLGKDDE
jgi:hypothetical protein